LHNCISWSYQLMAGTGFWLCPSHPHDLLFIPARSIQCLQNKGPVIFCTILSFIIVLYTRTLYNGTSNSLFLIEVIRFCKIIYLEAPVMKITVFIQFWYIKVYNHKKWSLHDVWTTWKFNMWGNRLLSFKKKNFEDTPFLLSPNF
jgi:hypothetical protein